MQLNELKKLLRTIEHGSSDWEAPLACAKLRDRALTTARRVIALEEALEEIGAFLESHNDFQKDNSKVHYCAMKVRKLLDRNL